MKKQLFVLILVCMGLLPLGAATVSVLVIESGLPPGIGCTPSAEVWESGMMDVFFDAGHIVSNAPCQQIPALVYEVSGTLPLNAGSEFDEARLGGSDFFVLVLLNYRGDTGESPKDVFIRVFRVSSGELLYETKVAGKTWGNIDEEFLDAKTNAGKVIPQLARKG